MNVYAPACADAGTAIESADDLRLPDVSVSEIGLSETVQPAGADAVKPIVPLNPLTEVTVIVLVAEWPAWILSVDGDAENVKSPVGCGGGGGGVVLALPKSRV